MGMRSAMEMMVTGDSISGAEAARLGWANRAHPADELEDRVLEVAERITHVPWDLVQLNKRTVHHAMDIMGLRAAIRSGTEICALGIHQRSMHTFLDEVRSNGLTEALQKRDEPFGDYRTAEPH
jgi:enoyl-CoA hydratase